MLIVSVSSNVEIEKTIKEVFSSFISDEISNFNSNVYYSNPDYLRCSYLDGRMLASMQVETNVNLLESTIYEIVFHIWCFLFWGE